jgi:hypothetical protein
MEIAATAAEKTTAKVRDIVVVPQLPEMDLVRRSQRYMPRDLGLLNFVGPSLMRTAGFRRPFRTR